MSPEQIKELRKALGCTARELAAQLKLEPKVVVAWEAGEEFPTKRYIVAMEALREKGPAAFPKPSRTKNLSTAGGGLARLADPKFWEVVRKLAEHPALFEQTAKLAADYPDPTA